MGGKAALEIDCEYGTVTRYLGERCSRVTAVAYAESHAEITRERTRDLGNIEVTLGLNSVFERKDKFDIVTLIDPFPCPSTRMAAGFSSNIVDLLHQIKLRETLGNPANSRDNGPVIAGQDWVDGRQAARPLGLRADHSQEADETREVSR
jgi:hypothetical protein